MMKHIIIIIIITSIMIIIAYVFTSCITTYTIVMI